ncbi:MAG: signal peptidase II [Betaproteobacteria bacterium]
MKPSSTMAGAHATSAGIAHAALWWRWLALSLVVIVADQVSKHAIVAAMQPGESRPYTSFFSLVLAFNSGAAFSFLADAQGWQRWFFVAIAMAAGVLLVWLLRRGGSAWFCCGVALILGGAIGNLYDRLVIGKVVDFLLFHYAQWSWPAFNVADSAITAGAFALIVDSFRTRHRQEDA